MKGSVTLPLDKSSNESIKQSICDYISKADIFCITHPTATNKWCLGINAEDSKTAEQLFSYFCHIEPFRNKLNKKLLNKEAAAWCEGKYNFVIVTQYSQSELEQIKNHFANFKKGSVHHEL